ncbi:hypothetical protein scyTo_0026846 [Scyliorhinus torazame]|uniref:Uncharacterized protein n=1 Tax=Scyliorhinus torazame TaxID=75743 RepID=A0A401QLH6_SCYTO|nr:hypothetical protein [Scyliorhinus torazame]
MSKSQVEALIKTVETLVQELEQTKAGCRQQAELNRDVNQRCERLEQGMEEMKKTMGELLDTKLAFEARERQVRKLSKQL